MTIYALHKLSQKGDVAPMEEFPSVERAAAALQTRVRKQASGAYFMSDPRPFVHPRPEVAFPQADDTGFMAVWVRRPSDMPPTPETTPDELWRVTGGGTVRREKWNEEKHQVVAAPEGNVVVPLLSPDHSDVAEAEAAFVAEEHPGFGAVAISYWLGGRMEIKEVQSGTCDCGQDDLHDKVSRVQSRLLGHEAFGLPPGTQVWHVRTGAPEAPHAKELARTVAKALGFHASPVMRDVA